MVFDPPTIVPAPGIIGPIIESGGGGGLILIVPGSKQKLMAGDLDGAYIPENFHQCSRHFARLAEHWEDSWLWVGFEYVLANKGAFWRHPIMMRVSTIVLSSRTLFLWF